MKQFTFALALSFSGLVAGAQSTAQTDSTGLPGDNFSLPGALELFKKASSPEEFEKLINTQTSEVNNLDLNEDGEIDYIKVIDKKEGDAQLFVLQAQVSETESQDIAVIEIEKTGEESAVLQIVGDEDIFGEQTIVEPTAEEAEGTAYFGMDNSLASGPNDSQLNDAVPIIVNVWFWPSVRYVYGPNYRVWVSPWGWRSRPIWWRPWRPVHYHAFYARRMHYGPRYSIVHTHRVVRAHRFYTPGRVTSVTVRTRHQASVTRYRTVHNGRNVKATRTTTTVEGPRGRKATRTTTTVRKKRRGR